MARDLPSIRVDPDRLIQVIVNLVSNAVKFCDKAQGRIAIRMWTEPAHLRVDVQDNGIGIASANLDKIFERFQQAGDTLTDKPEGTGLGLPISRQILQRFGGEIWVRERAGTRRNVFRPHSTCRPGFVIRRSRGRGSKISRSLRISGLALRLGLRQFDTGGTVRPCGRLGLYVGGEGNG